MTAPPEVAWTEQEFLERIRKYRDASTMVASTGSQRHAEQRDEHWAWIVAEIARLRAENERLTNERNDANDRAALADRTLKLVSPAATRERETPPQCAVIHGALWEARQCSRPDGHDGQHDFSTVPTSRSRVSDNG